ncbi:MAG: DUF3710 domain-containing protein [Bifidobacterium sp.]|jgi:hypothetical protein|nr:DUF3710 domain-containing protein [Bifidobacterium sp.]MCI1864375.1 DUF3710 domain-containing protein [Bifidobacterium sp.]
MGLFGFGRKKHHDDDAPLTDAPAHDHADAADERTGSVGTQADRSADEASETSGDEVQDAGHPTRVGADYVGRGEDYGPWDVDDEDIVDYDDYLDLGAYYLPFMRNIELRIKANRANRQVLGCTVTFGSSSLEIEAFAAPKTIGLWDDVRADLLEANRNASEVPGIFGMEARLPVSVKGGKTVITRIVGVDGPRWMLRGIFSGKAADRNGSETKALNDFFSGIVVDRGDEPLAPRDLIPMHAPVSPEQRKAAQTQENEKDADSAAQIPPRPTGPFDSDQQTETKSTLSRGPMFSEVR